MSNPKPFGNPGGASPNNNCNNAEEEVPLSSSWEHAGASTPFSSDSFLMPSDDDDEEEDSDEYHKIPSLRGASSSVYNEHASMEAIPESGQTRIEASGILGRRRISLNESILVPTAAAATRNGSISSSIATNTSSLLSSDPSLLLHGSTSSNIQQNNSSLEDLSMNDHHDDDDVFTKREHSGRYSETTTTAAAQSGSSTSLSSTSAATILPTTPPNHSMSKTLQVLQAHGIMVPPATTNLEGCYDDDCEADEARALYTVFEGFCIPPIELSSCAAALAYEKKRHSSSSVEVVVPLPEQPMICMHSHARNSRIVSLLELTPKTNPTHNHNNKELPILLQLPVPFADAVLRILIRILSHETDAEYDANCFRTLPWKTKNRCKISIAKEIIDPDHITRRPNVVYSVVRFQCTWMKEEGTHSQSINQDSKLAVQTVLALWEKVVLQMTTQNIPETSSSLRSFSEDIRCLHAPLARLLGILATAGLTPRILRRMIVLTSGPSSSTAMIEARLGMMRALKTAAAGSSWRSLPKRAPSHFFSLFGNPNNGSVGCGMQRTIHGLANWPFRNDFAICLWFRIEQFALSSSTYPILFSVRSDDGGGIEISIVPIDQAPSTTASANSSPDACTILITVYDSNSNPAASSENNLERNVPAHQLKVRGGCVLLPRVWYHLAVRHTRSRLKGVFSLSTRQQVSVMLDGKILLTESLPFPKIIDSDFNEESTGTSLLKSTLRRSTPNASLNMTLKFGSHFDGQTGALHIFNDNVSDASFRALYEMTGGNSGLWKRSHSLGDVWDVRRSDIVRKSRMLDAASMANADADEIVLSQRRHSSHRRKVLAENVVTVLDIGEESEKDESDVPAELQRASFSSKIFATWDPRRTAGSLALELHVGAHVKLDGVYSWRISCAQDAIGSIGGVQVLVLLFRSFLNGEIERLWSLGKAENSADDCRGVTVFTIIPELFKLLSSFIKDHNDNARELLRCGGIDVIEQLLVSCKRNAFGRDYRSSLFGAINANAGLTQLLTESLLEFRGSCSHYSGLEAKIFSRLLFNVPLWLGNFNQLPGVFLHTIYLPVLSSLVVLSPEKVRDCVGIKDMVNVLKEICSSKTHLTDGELNRFMDGDLTLVSEYGLSSLEILHVESIILAMVFNVVVAGTSPPDFSLFIRFLTVNLESLGTGSAMNGCDVVKDCGDDEVKHRLNVKMCTLLLFLMQIRPVVNGLFESFAYACGGVQGGAGWILCALVNSLDDEIRSWGIRCLAAYLDVSARGADSALSIGSPSMHTTAIPMTEKGNDMTSTVLRASSRISLMAKGLTSLGPHNGSYHLTPSKLTARVVFKLLWHLLKSHRARLSDYTHSALLAWITDSWNTSSLSSSAHVLKHLVVECDTIQPCTCFDDVLARNVLAEMDKNVGRTLNNPLAIGTALRLIRFLENELKDKLLIDLTFLAKSNRKCISVLANIPEWQTCLFPLISETLELVSADRSSTLAEAEGNQDRTASILKRLDLCLDLYSSLLGYLLREGSEKSLDAVERAASLQRVFVNGHHVLLLIFSGLCGNIFENGTLLEMGSLSAQDWKEVNIEQDHLLLKQSARLVTDSILSNGTKGLDLGAAVRSWRSLRHLAEVIVAVVTKSGFGVVDLFDYAYQNASSIDDLSGGFHGIRLSELQLQGIDAAKYVTYLRERSTGNQNDIDRRLCVELAAQVLTLLDAFIFPQSLDIPLSTSQLDGLALVRHSEARLGNSQGPLLSSEIRLSFLLLALVEPCSAVFLQCASRLKCLLCWALDLLRESNTSEGHSPSYHKDGIDHIDRLVLAVVLHCHRALGRCATLLTEIETASHNTYFSSKEQQKKYLRRLLRVALDLRDIVSTAYRGRNDILHSALSSEALEALRLSLEGAFPSGKSLSKEHVVRDFLASKWVMGFQDTLTRHDLSVPEQVSMDTIPLSSDQEINHGFATIEKLGQESECLVSDFENAIDNCFKEYLEVQRKWAETDAVRDLEYEGETTIKRLAEKYRSDTGDLIKDLVIRRNAAENRWRSIQCKVADPWKNEYHWKLARYTDLLGKRTLLVQNRDFKDHKDASYESALGNGNDPKIQKRLLEKKDLSDVMRRNAEAFIVNEAQNEIEVVDDDSSLHNLSDGESASLTDAESSTDAESLDADDAVKDQQSVEPEHDDSWAKIDSEEFQDVDLEGDGDAWAKTFIWTEGESTVAHFEPVMIVQLQTYVGGKILLTTHGLYFHQIGEEINVMTKEPIKASENSGLDPKDRRWRLTRLTEIHGRRYMLRPQALELFFSDSHELLLNFPGGAKDRDRFHAKIRNSCKVPMLWSPKSLNPRVIFRKTKLTELWKKRKLSNFEYIMALNRMAGRSFNDLTQYPIFPWILADYTSSTIDLSDSRIYRDLSKPIGALNPDRLAQLLERYKDLELFGFSKAESFLYGSHYSSPGIVLHFLIRQEPFTSMAIDLQSGRFDCPDRLFIDIGESWNSCLTSTSDFKELIPEFFCLPEMLINSNKFPLGRTQSGKLVDDVGLPPWSNGSAYEFVRIHRLALESEYVSKNLHHWIDLVFGYKQRGTEAEAAHNLFHHLSYEGSVDLDKIVDEVDRTAAESHIQNFGQTPSQLSATEPHPYRYSADVCWSPLISSASASLNLRCHTPSKQFANRRSEHAKGSVLKLHVMSDTILAIYADLSLGSYRWFPSSKSNRLRMDKLRPFARRDLSTSKTAIKRGSAVSIENMEKSSLEIGNWSFSVTLGGLSKEELRQNAVVPTGRLIAPRDISLSTAETSALIISCGYWDETLKVHSVDASRVITSENGGHHGAIRCLALGKDDALMVTGGQDCTCRVWVIDHPDMSAALSDGYVQTALGGSHDAAKLLSCCHVLWGHDSPIVCVDLDSSVDVVASGSESGLICIHTIRRGDFVRSFRPPVSKTKPAGKVSKIAMGTEGNLVLQMEDNGLHTYTINAVRLCSIDAGEKLNDMKVCSRDEVVVTGGEKCRVAIRSVHDLNICSVMDLSRHGPIRCIALTPDDLNPVNQILFVGSDDGMITIIDEDPDSTLKTSITDEF